MFGKNRRAVGSQLPCYIVVVLDGYRQAREPAGVIAILIFKVLSANAGARAQRLLWASTGSKDPKASDTLYVKALAAPFTINTMPENTLKAFADHGEVGELLAADGGDCERVLTSFAQAGVGVDALAAQLQNEGAASFVKSWGGMGIVIGDGQLPHPGLEQIIETYYCYAISASTKVSLDYQFVANPAYNTDRGPVNVFAGRFHSQF